MKAKYQGKDYIVVDKDCPKRPCFVPFSGNGKNICRLYELGQCKWGSPESRIVKGRKK